MVENLQKTKSSAGKPHAFQIEIKTECIAVQQTKPLNLREISGRCPSTLGYTFAHLQYRSTIFRQAAAEGNETVPIEHQV